MSTGSGELVEQWTAVSPQNSAHSSPSQLVPQFECFLDGLLLPEEIRDINTPFLKITQQPQGYYKFRYRSEMQNSHGCLHGKSYMKNSNERHFPEVELFNYSGPALIKCKLAQINNDHEHPHRLCVNDISDISFEVPKGDSYKAWFSDLCIVHTPSREVSDWLYRGHNPETLSPEEQTIVRRQCEGMGKLINLNIVRLKFSAHHPSSGEEICAPVFSDCIRNLKCAATNILKICRLSRCHGRVRGGDDVIMLVERVIRKNIMIRFFELNEDGEVTWTDTGRFLESEVHHQYAIAFRTPPYKDLNITKRVQVFVELVRPSDGKKSDPSEFFYTPEQISLNKKRKLSHFYEDIRSVPVVSNPLNSFVLVNHTETAQAEVSKETSSSQMVCDEKQTPMVAQSSIISQQTNENGVLTFKIPVTPAQISGASMGASISSAVNMVNDMDLFEKSDFTDYFDSLLAEFGGLVADTGRGKTRLEAGASEQKDETYDDQTIIKMHTETAQAEVSKETSSSQMVCDEKQTPMVAQSSIISQQTNENGVLTFKIPVTPAQISGASMGASISSAVNMVNDMDLFEKSDFTDYFDSLLAEFGGLVADTGRGKTRLEAGASEQKDETYDDQTIIKMMAKELQKIVEIIRIKRESFTKSLQALFDLRLSNGDTFLHLTLDSKQPLLDYLINLIHDSNLTHLLNLKNASAQTILHQAVANNLCDLVPFLVSKGCDPMLEDAEGNNAIHYGVKSEDSLGPLLDAAEKFDVPRNIDAFNYEKQTPLHLAVVYKSVVSTRLLLAGGASCGARDGAGRTPLHLAALDDCVPIATLLLEHLPSQVNEIDGRGYTALQIVCEKNVSDSTIAMVKLLLNHKADPTQHQEHNVPAWQLAKLKPAIRDLMQEYIPAEQATRDSDDEFESADEGETADEDVPEITYHLKHLE